MTDLPHRGRYDVEWLPAVVPERMGEWVVVDRRDVRTTHHFYPVREKRDLEPQRRAACREKDAMNRLAAEQEAQRV